MRRFGFIVLAFLFCVCAEAKTEISFQSGHTASDCASYNHQRKSERLADTVYNRMIASEYLECSLSPSLRHLPSYTLLLIQVNEQVRVRQFPLSLAQMVDRNDKLKALFMVQGNDSLAYEKENHNVKIGVKGMLTDQKYLLWVVDEILDANYRAYYPAVLSVDNGKFEIEPYYASGF